MTESSVIEVGAIEAQLLGVRLPFGLVLDRVVIKGVGLRVSENLHHISVSEPADLLVEVSEGSLCTFLERVSPGGLKSFEVKLESNRVKILAVKQVVVPLKLQAICSLRIESRTRIFVQLESAEVLGAGVARAAATQLATPIVEKSNPILDLTEFPFPAELNEVEIVDGKLIATGKVSPPNP